MTDWDDIQEYKNHKRLFKFTYMPSPEFSEFVLKALNTINGENIISSTVSVNIRLSMETACIDIYPYIKNKMLREYKLFFSIQLKDQKSYARKLSRLLSEENGDVDSERLWAVNFYRNIIHNIISSDQRINDLPIVYTYYTINKYGDTDLIVYQNEH